MHLLLVPGQLVVCTLCSCVMKTKQIWLFSAHMLPLLARLCLVPLETIVIINKFAMIFTGLEVLYFLGSNLLVPYNLAKSAYRELVQVRVRSTRGPVHFCQDGSFSFQPWLWGHLLTALLLTRGGSGEATLWMLFDLCDLGVITSLCFVSLCKTKLIQCTPPPVASVRTR